MVTEEYLQSLKRLYEDHLPAPRPFPEIVRLHGFEEDDFVRTYGIETGYMTSPVIEFKRPINVHQRLVLRRLGWTTVNPLTPDTKSRWVHDARIVDSDTYWQYLDAVERGIDDGNKARTDAGKVAGYSRLNSLQYVVSPFYILGEMLSNVQYGIHNFRWKLKTRRWLKDYQRQIILREPKHK